MTGVKDRLAAARARFPWLDHALRTQEHIGTVKASQQAGAVTYFGFISVFPILALAFAVVGFLSRNNPFEGVDIDQVLTDAIREVLPGIANGAMLDTVRENAPGIASIGLLMVLYSGLGWLSAMRTALLVVFELPEEEQPNFVTGKLRDLVSMVLIGVILMLAVSLTGVVNGASGWLLGFVPFLGDQGWVLKLLAVVVGLLANAVLFAAIFRLLARPALPRNALWSGALLGAVGFEALKQVATYLLVATKEQPAFQVFGIALVLVVWINYFARVLMYAAAWAHTSSEAVVAREATVAAQEARSAAAAGPGWRDRLAADRAAEGPASRWATPFAAGSAATLALVAVLKKRKH